MRAAITGATGYIGGRVAMALSRAGHAVFAIVRPESDTSRLLASVPNAALLRYDGDIESLSAWLAEHSIEVVIHLAAHQDQSDALAAVCPLVRSNVEFTAALAAAAHRADVPAFINTGTFSQHQGGTARYEPSTLYAASKQAACAFIEYYRRTGSMECVTLELTDVYGPEDTRGKLLDLVVRASDAGEPLELTPGEQLMSLVHVDDVVKAFIGVAEGLLAGREYARIHSVAAAQLMTLRETTELLLRVTGREAQLVWGGLPYPSRQVMRPFLHDPPPGWAPETTPEIGFLEVFGTRDT